MLKEQEVDLEYVSGKKNVLVIGGAGFIGSNLCEELVKESNVLCVDNYLTGAENNIDHLLPLANFEFIKHDISQPLDLEAVVEAAKFKVKFQSVQEIYYAACPTSPKEHDQYPIETLLANSAGVKNALDLAVKYKAAITFFSTSLVYGEPENERAIKEDYVGRVNQLGAHSCYDEGKRFAEAMVANYQKKYGLQAKIARIFNTYGPRMKVGDNLLIPYFIQQALAGASIEIQGPSERQVAICYVKDMVDGLIKLTRSEFTGPMNLGADSLVGANELAQKIIALTGSQVQITAAGGEIEGAGQGLPDIGLARKTLEWFPVVNLDDGLRKTIDFVKVAQGRVNKFV